MRTWLLVLWTAILAVTLAGSAYAIYRFWNHFTMLPEVWAEISFVNWTVIACAAAAFYFLDYLRLRVLLKLLGCDATARAVLHATFFAEFAAVLTPTAELHVPAAIYVLARNSVPPPKATAAVVTKTLYMILWICLCSLFAIFYFDGVALPRFVSEYLPLFAIPIMAVVLLYALMIVFARRLSRWAEAGRQQASSGRVMRIIRQWLGRSVSALAAIGSSTAPLHLLSHALCIVFLFSYCFIGFWICRALKIDLSIQSAVTVFCISLLVDYFAPVPGSVGVTELATIYMIDPEFSHRSLLAVVLLRVLCKYLPLLPGLAILAGFVRREGLKFLHGRQEGNAETRPQPAGSS